MSQYTGSCLCGAVAFQVQGKFDRFYLCHCQHCQKDTGSAHAANLFSQSAKLTWIQGEAQITSFLLPGTRHRKSFCSCCGSALPVIEEGCLVVPAGSLDTSLSLKPTAHIFNSSRAEWDFALEQVVSFEELPE